MSLSPGSTRSVLLDTDGRGWKAPKGVCVVLCVVLDCHLKNGEKAERSRMSVMEPKGVDGVREGDKQKKEGKRGKGGQVKTVRQ